MDPHTPTNPMDLSGAAAFLAGFLEGVKAGGRQARAEAAQERAVARKKMGLRKTGPAPYGFSKSEDGRFMANRAERETIRYMAGARARGISWREIAKVLNSEGSRMRCGKPWTLHSASNTMRSARKSGIA